jgi:hypothetical protein
VSDSELVRRAHIQHRHQPLTRTLKQFLSGYRLEFIARGEIAAHDPIDLGTVSFGHVPKHRQQGKNGIVGETVEHELAVPPRRDKPRPPKVLQVLRGVGDGQANPLRQRLDAPLALGQMLQDLKTMGVPEGARDGCELGE